MVSFAAIATRRGPSASCRICTALVAATTDAVAAVSVHGGSITVTWRSSATRNVAAACGWQRLAAIRMRSVHVDTRRLCRHRLASLSHSGARATDDRSKARSVLGCLVSLGARRRSDRAVCPYTKNKSHGGCARAPPQRRGGASSDELIVRGPELARPSRARHRMPCARATPSERLPRPAPPPTPPTQSCFILQAHQNTLK